MRTKFLLRMLAWFALTIVSLNVVAQAQTTPLRIGYQKYGTLLLLKSRGTLERQLRNHGVQVRWVEFPGGPQLLEGLNVGAIDFGVTGETPPIFALAAGADLQYLAYEPPSPQGEAIIVPGNSPIRSVSDLRGKRVALNKGSNVHYLLVRALEQAGLRYSDIRPIYLSPSDARAAFENRRVDAWVIWDPFLAAAQTQLQTRTLVTGEGLVDNHQFYLVSRSFHDANPQLTRILLEEIRSTGHWITQNPQEAAQMMAPVLGLSRDITLTSIRRQRTGAFPADITVLQKQQAIADNFAALRLIPRQLKIDGELLAD